MTAMDTVWSRMKATAATHASDGVRLTQIEAHRLIVQYLREAAVNPWPPADAIAFLASEMLQMMEGSEPTSVV